MLISTRPDGWQFAQGNHLLQAYKSDRFHAGVSQRESTQEGGGSVRLAAEGFRSGKPELAVGDMYNHATLIAEKNGTLAFDKDWDGKGPMKGGDIHMKAVGPREDGRQTYEVACADQRYTVINDQGRLSVSQDHGPAGPSSGDWSMDMADDGAITLSAVDARNRRVEVVDKSDWDLADEAAHDIRQLLEQGEERNALAAYREYLTFGNETTGRPLPEYEQYEVKRDQERFKATINQALFEVAGYQEGKEPVLTSPLLQEMGLSRPAAQALTQSKEYEIDPPGWFNGYDKEVSNLEVLHRVKAAGSVAHREYSFESLKEWLEGWEDEGRISEVLSAAQHVYSQQGGQIKEDWSTGWLDVFDMGKPDSVSEFDRKYGSVPY